MWGAALQGGICLGLCHGAGRRGDVSPGALAPVGVVGQGCVACENAAGSPSGPWDVVA